jgi:LSD1 subclass zinc finger protein
VAEPLPCPKCGSLLRLPAGATAARCPKCQNVITITAPPSPEAPATPAAAPLPFGRAKAVQPQAAPVVRPVQAAPAKPVETRPSKPEKKGVSPYDEKREETDPVEDAEEKRRQMKKELKKLEQEKQEEAEWLEELIVLCKRGRISMHLITWGIRAYLLAVLLQMAAMVGGATGVFFVATTGVFGSAFFAIITSILFMVGFGFSIAGPYEVRHLGIMGLVVTIFHLILGLIQPGNLAIVIGLQGFQESSRSMWHELLIIQDILGVATDFPLLADHPARFMNRYNFSIPGLIVAAAEFTRLVVFSMLALSYARGGKHPEHGHTCMNAINRIFWIVLLNASFRLAIAAAFDGLNKDDMLFKIGVGVHWSLTMGVYIALMVMLLIQSQHVNDTIEIIDHRYWADKRERLDSV